MIFVAVIVNITKISVYPNTWALLTLIHLIVPKYLVSSPKWFRSISVFFPLNLHMLCMCVIPACLSICSYEVKSRTLLVPVTRLWKTIFPQIRVGDGFRMIQVHHIHCANDNVYYQLLPRASITASAPPQIIRL